MIQELLIFAGAVIEAFVRLHEKGLIYQGRLSENVSFECDLSYMNVKF